MTLHDLLLNLVFALFALWRGNRPAEAILSDAWPRPTTF